MDIVKEIEIHNFLWEGINRSVNIPKHFWGKTFENFKTISENEKSVSLIKNYACKFDLKSLNDGKGLYIFGATGVGKTHLVASVIQSIMNPYFLILKKEIGESLVEEIERKKQNRSDNTIDDSDLEETIDMIFSHYQQIIKYYLNIFFEIDPRRNVQNYEFIKIFFTSPYQILDSQKRLFGTKDIQHENLKTIMNADILILDDIGSDQIKHSDWELNILFQIIAERHSSKKPTLFTSCYDLGKLGNRFMRQNAQAEIEKLLSRIWDINDGIEIFGKDYRFLKS